MWISSRFLDLFNISQTSFKDLREELVALKTERDALKHQVRVAEINADFLRIRVNQLEALNAGLIEKAYQIKLPVPQILTRPQVDPAFDPRQFDFNDMGDDMAKKLGFPVYDN